MKIFTKKLYLLPIYAAVNLVRESFPKINEKIQYEICFFFNSQVLIRDIEYYTLNNSKFLS